MEKAATEWTLGELARLFNGELRGPEDHRVARPAPAASDDALGLGFATSEKYLEAGVKSGVGALLVPRECPPIPKPAIAVDDPRGTFGRFLAMNARPLPIAPGIHPTAVVDALAEVDPGASIGAYAVVERGARIGPGCRVYPFAYIGEDCVLEERVSVLPHAVLVANVHVGARSLIQPAAVLGTEGFGFVWDGTRQMKVPQVGGVTLGQDVEIGSLTAVDRATAGQTTIGDGTKLDNLIQIGHNSQVGKHTVMASFVGISGSSTIGDRVTIAGQAATSDHVNVCSDVTLGGRTGVTKDITEPGTYWGTPVRPFNDELRSIALARKIPSLFDRVKELERRLAELEKND